MVGMTRLPGLGMDTGAERGTQVRVLRLAPSMQLERTAITVTLESVLATVVVIVHWQLKSIGPDMPKVWGSGKVAAEAILFWATHKSCQWH